MALSKELSLLYPPELYIERVTAVGDPNTIEIYADTSIHNLEEDTIVALYRRVAVFKIRHETKVVGDLIDE